MIIARPRNEEDGMSVRRGAVPGARIFRPFMRDVSPPTLSSAVPDSHTTERRAGNPVEVVSEAPLSEALNLWKQHLTHQSIWNSLPPSFASCANRWRRSRLPLEFPATMSRRAQRSTAIQ